MKHILAALAVSLLASACATEPQASADEGYSRSNEREYSTGSNIPRKRGEKPEAGLSTYDREAVQRARDAAHQAPRPGLGGAP